MTHSIKTFFSTWAEPNSDAIRASVTAGIRYQDPRTPEPLVGPEAVASYVAMFSEHAPGASAEVVAQSETGSFVRATVAFRMADGKEQHGQYFVDLSEDGRMQRLIGFAGLGAPE
ncbi:MAG: nuclear transport factor 2 family protein [Pseudomonadota bacterium]